ncbi:MAG: hypothetical protein LBD64_01770 [Odoribacteraceae bacterium]|jgi:hypothetical protein|nr:hypothetical protein [Odoribacteraceae bacterium]
MMTNNHDNEEMALYLLFDEIVQPDAHPDKKTEQLYEKMKHRLGFEDEHDNLTEIK